MFVYERVLILAFERIFILNEYYFIMASACRYARSHQPHRNTLLAMLVNMKMNYEGPISLATSVINHQL